MAGSDGSSKEHGLKTYSRRRRRNRGNQQQDGLTRQREEVGQNLFGNSRDEQQGQNRLEDHVFGPQDVRTNLSTRSRDPPPPQGRQDSPLDDNRHPSPTRLPKAVASPGRGLHDEPPPGRWLHDYPPPTPGRWMDLDKGKSSEDDNFQPPFPSREVSYSNVHRQQYESDQLHEDPPPTPGRRIDLDEAQPSEADGLQPQFPIPEASSSTLHRQQFEPESRWGPRWDQMLEEDINQFNLRVEHRTRTQPEQLELQSAEAEHGRRTARAAEEQEQEQGQRPQSISTRRSSRLLALEARPSRVVDAIGVAEHGRRTARAEEQEQGQRPESIPTRRSSRLRALEARSSRVVDAIGVAEHGRRTARAEEQEQGQLPESNYTRRSSRLLALEARPSRVVDAIGVVPKGCETPTEAIPPRIADLREVAMHRFRITRSAFGTRAYKYPVNEMFVEWGRKWIIQRSTIRDGESIKLPKTEDEEVQIKYVPLFPFVGATFKLETFDQVAPWYPTMRRYAIQMIKGSYTDQSQLLIVGEAREDFNLAAFINSNRSIEHETGPPNCEWQYVDNTLSECHYTDRKCRKDLDFLQQQSQIRYYVMTVARKNIAKGDELFINYDYRNT